MSCSTIPPLVRQTAAEVKTPFFLVDIDGIRASLRAHQQAWASHFPRVEVAYSYKSNSLADITRLFAREGLAAEVVSGRELELALQDGFQPDKIYFDGPLKTPDELRSALEAGVAIQVDSLPELSTVLELSDQLASCPRISMRLATRRPNGRWSRFGLLLSEVATALQLLDDAEVRLSGLHFHVGSNQPSPRLYRETIAIYGSLFRQIVDLYDGDIWLDIGGGFPSKSQTPAKTPEIAEFADAVATAFRAQHLDPHHFTLVVEPGRSLVEDHGYLVSRVRHEKRRNGRRLLVLDAGRNLIPSLETWHHPIEVVHDAPELAGSLDQEIEYDLFGAQCFESDSLARGFTSPVPLSPGTLLVFGEVGAYDLATSHSWIRQAPPVLTVSEEQWQPSSSR
ncbi:hypothetical protein FIV42_10490 [Persicimonas caeni]|uniref:Orn/DAP/Arg decarboxylase 2 N-terminal domain-containing protein n=1 Tax=Persicimonas caeni TaxID=2292766 RepID=A0A4Y6PS48_PERCE|nr:hypothetical protein [Persicimonas caeni]QDG51148.1 hypothetical protein FIV42_10490 [Persicimonas caeni]QED32369.1 hypothetical protein FRD00_10485 [Persicimonas caeni]